ncbi:sensor histidine kinase [Paenibacillus radicis (ex Xue et al. 2023)]|uniref:histidine kinase n=1 Tax=Paenibacillus radicis (ex Xue et al. 2023) TaxID=2972489 RepID=A0ABT1YAG7_9BACL|nr:sensor histidine kinase [Paenibacillus radicis (ex Xue et al. 2023)]MCR8630182.1 sensor histidine kinase [Paenibacillus radicis (ex Xue et al. 2023)]
MRKPTYKLYFLFLAFLLFLLLPSASALGKSTQTEAVKGILDLSAWNWERDGLQNLDGEWELYWNHLLTPDDFTIGLNSNAPSYALVPKVWEGQESGGQALSNQGYATYRLRIHTAAADNGTNMALYVPSIATAYQLWINGELAAANGKVGTSKETMIPANFPKPVFFHLQGTQTEIVIQVSNFVQRKGGLWESFRIGVSKDVIISREKEIAFQLLMIGSLFTMGLYHIGLFLARRKNRSPLFFGCFSLAMGLRAIVTGPTLITYLFPHIAWEFQVHLEYLSVVAALWMLILFSYSRYPGEMYRKVRDLFVIAIVAYSFFILLTPALIYTYSMLAFQAVSVLIICYIIYVSIRAFLSKREGASLNIAAVLVLLVLVLNDILFYNHFVATGDLMQLGMLFYVFMESVNLSHQFSKSFARVESMSGQLQEWNELLEQKVQERTEALELSNVSIKKINQELVKMELSRRHLLSNISHELGTPLTLIQGYVKAVLDRMDEDNRDRYLRLTYEKTLILDRIISDLFELSKFDTGKVRFDYQAVDSVAFCRSLFEKLELPIKQEGHSFAFIDNTGSQADKPLIVWIDVVRIEQVVMNLLFNAQKFTPASGSIHLIVEKYGSLEKGDLGLKVKVRDTGNGIDDEDIPFVFDRFYRGRESHKSRSAGTGLGLAICKEIIEHHGGTIDVESKSGKGSTFTFTLPVMVDMEEGEEDV